MSAGGGESAGGNHAGQADEGGCLHLKVDITLTPVINLCLLICPRIFVKLWNCLQGILKGLGETDSRKKLEELKISSQTPFNRDFIAEFNTGNTKSKGASQYLDITE